MELKNRRERVRMEILKWHPDKFNAKVLGKVIDAAQVAEGAGLVARFLTQIMEEETEKETVDIDKYYAKLCFMQHL